MGHDGFLDALRAAARNPAALSRLLAAELPNDALQHIGDAALTVDEVPDTDLTEPVDRLIDQLCERCWDGDQELVGTLEDVNGRRRSPLRPLPVELADVGEALSERAGTENYLDLHTGAVWLHTMTDFGVAEDLDVDLSDETRWLLLRGEGSDEAYRDLQRFIATVDDDLGARLTEAIVGRGAFRRFPRCSRRIRPSSRAGTASTPTPASDMRAAGSRTGATKLGQSAQTTSHKNARAKPVCVKWQCVGGVWARVSAPVTRPGFWS